MRNFNAQLELAKLKDKKKWSRKIEKAALYCKKTPYDRYKLELIALWQEEGCRLADLVRYLKPMFPKIHHQQVKRALHTWGVIDD